MDPLKENGPFEYIAYLYLQRENGPFERKWTPLLLPLFNIIEKMDPLEYKENGPLKENGPFECMDYLYLLKENGPSCSNLCFMFWRKWPLWTILDASPKKMAPLAQDFA